jgi:hypothetical protein
VGLFGTPARDGLFREVGQVGMMLNEVLVKSSENTNLALILVPDGTFKEDEVPHLILQEGC